MFVVRTQDRKRLLNIERGIDVSYSGLSIIPIGFTGVLGTYSTEEKVLKVIDKICIWLDDIYGDNGRIGNIFLMPLDDEV